MAWTTPTVRATGDLVTASIWNGDVVNNLKYLHGDAGTTDLINTLRFGNGSTLRGHRHPYSNDRHIESGSATASLATSAETSASVTFTDAYAVAPQIAVSGDSADGSAGNSPIMPVFVWATGVGTTGFTLRYRSGTNTNPQTATARWISEGQD